MQVEIVAGMAGIGTESWWRRSLRPYRPVQRRYADGHLFTPYPFQLQKVVRQKVRYCRRKTMQHLLEMGGFAGDNPYRTFDREILRLNDQYDIAVEDVVNINIFVTTEECCTLDVIRFFNSIRFGHIGPVEVLSIAATYEHEHNEGPLVGLDYTGRNTNISHRVIVLDNRDGVATLSLRNTLNTPFIPNKLKYHIGDTAKTFNTIWNKGTRFGGYDKNYHDPMPYEST